MSRLSPLLTVEEAAELLRIQSTTVYDWAAKGLLPHIRILAGTRRPVIRFRETELESFLQQKSVPSSGRTE